MLDRRIRVLVAKPGLHGHDRGAKIVAWAVRDEEADIILELANCYRRSTQPINNRL